MREKIIFTHDEMLGYTKRALFAAGFEPEEKTLLSFVRFAELLAEWNEKMNLTAITSPEEIAVKHFADSALLLKAVDIPQGASFIDIGTGAGFPGVPLKLLRPDIRLTLLDSLNKRLVFLKAALSELGCEAELVHSRAEELPKASPMRESFDFAAARAVAPLKNLCPWCIPYVKRGGVFAAMKGPGIEAELDEGNLAAKKCGARMVEIKSFRLEGGDERRIVLYKKL